MADPRLNSIHLDPGRRQEFRRAREALLSARGWQTLAGEQKEQLIPPVDRPNTIVIQGQDHPTPPDLDFWLMDREFVYPLRIGLNTVGRAPDNDVVVQDAYVSRRHCAVLVHANGDCEVHDIASKNGTFLNGKKIPGPTRLNPGDEIRMCDRQLVFLTKKDVQDMPAHMPTQTKGLERGSES